MCFVFFFGVLESLLEDEDLSYNKIILLFDVNRENVIWNFSAFYYPFHQLDSKIESIIPKEKINEEMRSV